MKSTVCTAGLIVCYIARLLCCAQALLQLLLAPSELHRTNIFTSRGTGCAYEYTSTGSVIAYVFYLTTLPVFEIM
jgi:hypothetical protein